MATSEFRMPGRFIFGAGALANLGREARRIADRAVLVTGRRAMERAGITARAMASLADAGVHAALFDHVEPEPDVTTVDRLRGLVRQTGAGVVIGLGGGSAMDAAKAAAGLAGEDAPTCEFHHGEPIGRTSIPNIAVPTTAGTGSEMTSNGVISDRGRKFKNSIRGDSLVPTVALVDPELTLASPPDVTAMSGIDALVQAVESYISLHATPMTEAVSLASAEQLMRALPAVVARGDDLGLRTAAAWGATMSGLALSNARLGVVHGLASPAGVRFGVPHGLICGILMPVALEFNRAAVPSDKWQRLCGILGGDPVQVTFDLLSACGLATRLTSFKPDPSMFDDIAEETLESGSTKANPRPVARADVLAMLREVC